MTDKKYNFYAFCQESHLPPNGWIHACYSCEKATSRFIIYRKDEKNNKIDLYQLMLCFQCQDYYKKNSNKLITLKQHIKEQYDIESNID